jgi:hypothetical protein
MITNQQLIDTLEVYYANVHKALSSEQQRAVTVTINCLKFDCPLTQENSEDLVNAALYVDFEDLCLTSNQWEDVSS